MNNKLYELNHIVSEFQKFSSDLIELGPEIKDDRLKKFETKHNLKLPLDYKALISKYNGVDLMGSTIYGVYEDDMGENLERLYYREHFLVQVPQFRHFVPFCPDGGGNFYCFDTRGLEVSGQECPIVFWESNVMYEAEPEVVSNSFYEWVVDVFIGWVLRDYDYDGTEK